MSGSDRDLRWQRDESFCRVDAVLPVHCTASDKRVGYGLMFSTNMTTYLLEVLTDWAVFLSGSSRNYLLHGMWQIFGWKIESEFVCF